MKIICRRVLLLVGLGAIAIAIPQLVSALDSDGGAALKLAMGPTSAAQKNQSAPNTSDNTKCTGGTCPKPYHRSKRVRAGPAVH
jgi:hypothetical protein